MPGVDVTLASAWAARDVAETVGLSSAATGVLRRCDHPAPQPRRDPRRRTAFDVAIRLAFSD